MVRQVAASEAQTGLPGLLDEVERGATIAIARGGRVVARIVPEPAAAARPAVASVAAEALRELRRAIAERGETFGPEEIAALRDAGRR